MSQSKGFFGNLDMMEIIPLAAGGYGAYFLFSQKNTVPAIAAAGATFFLLNGASASVPKEDSGETGKGFQFKSFGVVEILTVAAFGYAAYEAFGMEGGTLAGAALAGAGLVSLFLASKSTETFE